MQISDCLEHSVYSFKIFAGMPGSVSDSNILSSNYERSARSSGNLRNICLVI